MPASRSSMCQAAHNQPGEPPITPQLYWLDGPTVVTTGLVLSQTQHREQVPGKRAAPWLTTSAPRLKRAQSSTPWTSVTVTAFVQWINDCRSSLRTPTE